MTQTSVQESETPRWQTSLVLLVFCLLFMLSFLSGKLIHRFRLRIFTESGATMFIGLIAGLINYLLSDVVKITSMLKFNVAVFDFFILPAIIFEGGYSLRKRGLFKNLITVLMYAVLGTLWNAIFIGMVVWIFAKIGVDCTDPNNPMESFVFGSILSAIDPVATLAILSDVLHLGHSLKIPRIFNLVFGESVINDAVAIVLYRIFIRYVGVPFTFLSFLEMIGLFFYVSIGSVVVGLLIGFGSALFFKLIPLKENHAAEILSMIIWAFASYLIAEVLGMSGIMSLFVCAIIMGRYTWYNLSEYSKIASPHTFKSLAAFADTYVFLGLGLAIFTFTDVTVWKFGFIALTIPTIIIGRALHVFPLSAVANCWRKKKITWKEMVFLTSAGMRGAIAFALSIHVLDVNTPNAREMVSTVLVVILATVLIGGGLTYPLLLLLGLVKKHEQTTDAESTSAVLLIQHQEEKKKTDYSDDRGTKFASVLRSINNKLRPIFRQSKDKTSTVLRDLLNSGIIPSELKIVECDLNSARYDDIRALALKRYDDSTTANDSALEQHAQLQDDDIQLQPDSSDAVEIDLTNYQSKPDTSAQ